MGQKILPDGSVEGKTFSEKPFDYPDPKIGEETYREYRERVKLLQKEGFHIGDLGWDDYKYYCMGSGQFKGVNSDDIIGTQSLDDFIPKDETDENKEDEDSDNW